MLLKYKPFLLSKYKCSQSLNGILAHFPLLWGFIWKLQEFFIERKV
nr:hypothetical protein B11C_10011 [Bartonella sp. 1-1C]